MTAPNGHDDSSGTARLEESASVGSIPLLGRGPVVQFTPEQIKYFVNQLEVPFDESVIEWRVTNTTKRNGTLRGQIIPYADQRAYTDRLNALFTPAGWTRKYAVQTTANFQRSDDQKLVAKVFVTCEVTIFGLGSHSATGEEWTDDENAVTAAEAQAFKRAAACFGLGRYLYYFSGIWVDLDERKQPSTAPELAGWATPEGWRHGLRPQRAGNRLSSNPENAAKTDNGNQSRQNGSLRPGEDHKLVRQIEGMAEPLGKGMYRGLLKTLARVWSPSDIRDAAMLQKVLTHMQSAARGLGRLQAALDQTGAEPLEAILRSQHLKSLDQVNSLEVLHEIVVALEAKARA